MFWSLGFGDIAGVVGAEVLAHQAAAGISLMLEGATLHGLDALRLQNLVQLDVLGSDLGHGGFGFGGVVAGATWWRNLGNEGRPIDAGQEDRSIYRDKGVLRLVGRKATSSLRMTL